MDTRTIDRMLDRSRQAAARLVEELEQLDAGGEPDPQRFRAVERRLRETVAAIRPVVKAAKKIETERARWRKDVKELAPEPAPAIVAAPPRPSPPAPAVRPAPSPAPAAPVRLMCSECLELGPIAKPGEKRWKCANCAPPEVIDDDPETEWPCEPPY